MTEARQRVAQLSARLAALDAEIATLRSTLGRVERGECDHELPGMYAALLERSTLDALPATTPDIDALAAIAPQETPDTTPPTTAAGTGDAATGIAPMEVSEATKDDPEPPVSAAATTAMEEDGDKDGKTKNAHEGVSETAVKEEPSEESKGDAAPAAGAEGEKASEEEEETAAALQGLQGRLEAVLGAAMRRDRETRFFDHAVTAEEAPMYAQEVLCACDFGLLRRRLRRGRYGWPACASVRDACALFVRDLALVFANAAVFNPPGAASGVLELSRKILQSARRHLAEHHIWPLPSPTECAALLPRRRASRAAPSDSNHGNSNAEATGGDNTTTHDADEPPDTPDGSTAATAAAHPPSKRRRRSALAAS